MKVVIAESAVVDEVDDFHHLSIQWTGGNEDLHNRLAAAGAGHQDADGKWWIDLNWLRRTAASDANHAWNGQFDAMVAFAQSSGWIDHTGTSVQVHIGPEVVRP